MHDTPDTQNSPVRTELHESSGSPPILVATEEKELASLRADRARLDWIEREVHDFEFCFRKPGWDRDAKNCASTGKVFRAVVDAAMRVTANDPRDPRGNQA